ncbi:MAG: TIGR03986 family CRISPR-associated RAMP protein [Candidatus Eisenbacteria bacterium]|nr:TIGR03986 family CRISPR-associated RAMP protein [Candidatus Eisenbacteria bacterium]
MPPPKLKSKVHAPYNFVPLSRRVREIPEKESISQDVPFSDGLCGHLVVELEAQTPICAGGAHEDQTVKPFRTPENRLAIPGTSIKGMLRNVLEIVTFSKFQLVDRDRRFAVRDLHNRSLYGDHMTVTEDDRHQGKPVYRAVSKPGYLTEVGGEWKIEPCKVTRVEQGDLVGHLKAKGEVAAAQALFECFTSRSTMPKKYRAWDSARIGRELAFDHSASDLHYSQTAGGFLRFDLATRLGGGRLSGELVMSGQGSPNERLKGTGKKGKHREFIFHDPSGASDALTVPTSVRRDFELNHSKGQSERHKGSEAANEEWKYWKRHLGARRIPVFYLEEDGIITSLGMTQMYRLAYRHTVGDTIDHTSAEHNDPELVDFAEALFGYVRSHGKGEAAKGRVDVGLFMLEGAERIVGPFVAVLSNPKPTYYPAYIDQTPVPHQSEVQLETYMNKGRVALSKYYATFMDEQVELRGWKRYPTRGKAQKPSKSGLSKSDSRWYAVDTGGTYAGRIRFHNLRPAELGALLWVLDFGGDNRLTHSIGYAKPFGFGCAKLKVREASVRGIDGGTAYGLEQAREAFRTRMDEWWKGWEDSEQITELLAMANPHHALDRNLNYMVLDHKRRRNDFTDAKKEGYVLPRYSRA